MNFLKNLNKNEIILLLIAIILIGIIIFMRSCEKKDNNINLLNNTINYSDSSSYWKNKYGEVVATNTVLTSNSAKDFLTIQSKDKTIQELQKLVKDYKNQLGNSGSVVIIGGNTDINHTTPTVITNPPVNNKDSLKLCNPIYSSSFSDDWITYDLKAKSDSTILHLKTINKYEVIVGERRSKWYKKKESFVDVISKSPYDKVNTISAYKVTDKRPRRISIGIQVGIGYTFKGIQPYIGIGGSFNLINIK